MPQGQLSPPAFGEDYKVLLPYPSYPERSEFHSLLLSVIRTCFRYSGSQKLPPRLPPKCPRALYFVRTSVPGQELIPCKTWGLGLLHGPQPHWWRTVPSPPASERGGPPLSPVCGPCPSASMRISPGWDGRGRLLTRPNGGGTSLLLCFLFRSRFGFSIAFAFPP